MISRQDYETIASHMERRKLLKTQLGELMASSGYVSVAVGFSISGSKINKHFGLYGWDRNKWIAVLEQNLEQLDMAIRKLGVDTTTGG